MITKNLIKKIKLLTAKRKVLVLLAIIFIVSIPIIAIAYTYNPIIDGQPVRKKDAGYGFKVSAPIFHNSSTVATVIATSTEGVCIKNSSDKDYFVPTGTSGEWANFFNNYLTEPAVQLDLTIPTGVCDGDAICNLAGGENGSNAPIDCLGVAGAGPFTLIYDDSGTTGTISGSSTQVIARNGNGAEVTAVPVQGEFVMWDDGFYSATRRETNVTVSKTYTPIS